MASEHNSTLKWSGDQITQTSEHANIIYHIAMATVHGPGMSFPPSLFETPEMIVMSSVAKYWLTTGKIYKLMGLYVSLPFCFC